MPRENSFSDEDGRSLTPDIEDAMPGVVVHPPTYSRAPTAPSVARQSVAIAEPTSPKSPVRPTRVFSSSKERFKFNVKKVIQMNRMSTGKFKPGIGAEPGVDPRRESAFLAFGHIREKCIIEIADYSGVNSSFGRMNNKSFSDLMLDDRACAREPWVKVRWINIGGISWDVISAVAMRYGKFISLFLFGNSS
jgi:hypothetical protein